MNSRLFKKNLIVWKTEDLEKFNEECEDYMLNRAEGNSTKAPQFMPDKKYFEVFLTRLRQNLGN